MGAKEIVNTENCAMRQRDRAILCVADVNTTDSWGGLSGPLRSVMGAFGDGTERRRRTQPLFVSAKEVSHTGASGLPLFMLRSLCYQRGMLTTIRGSTFFQGPAPADNSQK